MYLGKELGRIRHEENLTASQSLANLKCQIPRSLRMSRPPP